MAHDIILPKLGTNMTEATIIRWLKQEGDSVYSGEPIVEVETEKATFEVTAEVNGILHKVLAQPGDVVTVAFPIAVVGEAKEDLKDHLKEINKKRAQYNPDQRHDTQSHARWRKSEQTSTSRPGSEPVAPVNSEHRILATPAARRLARERGVDLVEMSKNTSQGNLIQEEDVRRASNITPVAIFGAGLGAAQVLDVLRLLPQFQPVALADDSKKLQGQRIGGYPVYGMTELRKAISNGKIQAVVVSLHSEFRRSVYQRLRNEFPDVSFPAVIHPSTYIGDGVVMEDGVLVEAGAVIGTETIIHEGTIVDMGVTISHHCEIGSFCHLAPGCIISGDVKILENTVVMAGATINNTSTIGSNVVVTPGSAVASDTIGNNVVVHGNPARIIGRSKRGG